MDRQDQHFYEVMFILTVVNGVRDQPTSGLVGYGLIISAACSDPAWILRDSLRVLEV